MDVLYSLIGIIDVYTIDPQFYLFELINEIINSLYHMFHIIFIQRFQIGLFMI